MCCVNAAGIFSQAVASCVDAMGRAKARCEQKMSFFKDLACWPLRLTQFCKILDSKSLLRYVIT